MSEVQLNLVVIRSSHIERSALFYQRLGLKFTKHQHGNGLEHFASKVGHATFEIYPCIPDAPPTTSTRLGFQVDSVDDIILELKKYDVSIISAPVSSLWGRRAIVADPDGHRVELTQII